ncbi:PREDICTED: uncharacterized protein LOC104822046 isoform X2 [Tarenaya hassleriana]|uniref:uncharacterized protein LOC104822046 isoform X2 n=1 Tax=Tarenaya hassleriana TaxID=28532 RepID=UPI00053C58A6|nr:PREDICTED: uncharacterized protein LOC104822046 isoform X2 [Tarenaya hassleriana]
MEDVKEKELSDDNNKNIEDEKDSDKMKDHEISPSKLAEDAIKKKYGGLLPKKHPLIAKDHERAFFDSADWALGKQKGQKPKGSLEALRPKLQPTPHQQLRTRRLAYASDDNNEESEDEKIDDQSCSSSAVVNSSLKENGEEGNMESNSKTEHSEIS